MENITETATPKRPTFLTVLCILTFISAGTGMISSLLTPPFSDVLVEMVRIYPGLDESIKADAIKIYQAGWNYHLTTFILSSCSLIGGIMMWNLKKNGFHFYALSNLGLLFIPMLLLEMPTSWGSILLTSGFIGMYAVHLKEMK